MTNNLDTIIAHYEEEKEILLQTIANLVRENDFEYAQYYQIGLWELNNRLDVLKHLKDNRYYEKKNLLERIHNMEKMLESNQYRGLEDYLEEEIRISSIQLGELAKLPISEIVERAPIIEQYLSKLIKKEIKSFRLVLAKSDNLVIDCKYHKKGLKLSFPYVKAHLKKSIINKYQVNALRGIGFCKV